jgi:hypothetical protein
MPERILEYLPDFYRQILDYRELDKTESIELDSMKAAIEQLYNDQFVISSSDEAIKRREKILGIQSDPKETLDFRKKRILNRYQTKPPFTIRFLQQQLDFLVGKGKTRIDVDVQKFILTVTTNIEDAIVFKEVQYTVEKVKPANLQYLHNTGIEETIELVENIKKYDMDWQTRLGTWRIGVPFATLVNEVVIK